MMLPDKMLGMMCESRSCAWLLQEAGDKQMTGDMVNVSLKVLQKISSLVTSTC
jgi:hypothetical protein